VLQIAHFSDAFLNLKNNIIKKCDEFFGEYMMAKETINMDFKHSFNESALSLTVEDLVHRFRKSMVRYVVAIIFLSYCG